MDIAIVGAAGSCGRQLAAQFLDRRLLFPSAHLQLVGHKDGRSANELWGLRADLEDAFVDDAPTIEVVFEPSAITADLVVMLAGATVSTDLATISTDLDKKLDRARLGSINRKIFSEYAESFVHYKEEPPIVIVQSNPVELGVKLFAEKLGRKRVIGAGAWSDTLRLRAEIASDLGVRRPQVHALMLGQHGDYIIPTWSQLSVRGIARAKVDEYLKHIYTRTSLSDLPQEIPKRKEQMLDLVRQGQVHDAYALVQSFPSDLRAAVKPFFTHFTAGRTTEMATAHAVIDIAAALITGEQKALSAQVLLEGEWLDLKGVIGAPIILGPKGWEHVDPLELSAEEVMALKSSAEAIATASASIV